jgi:predicted TPR repeat methyltransferase
MPIGSFSTYRDVVQLLCLNRPKSVLDLGIGHGINGAGVRNWLDVGWKYETRVVGVEGFKDYKSPLWDCYNKVHECTIQKFFETNTEKFDCVLMTDVLEHFEKTEARFVISKAKACLNPGGVFVIVTPGVWIEQDAAYGNELEIHRSLWCDEDLRNQGFRVIKDGSEDDMGYRMIVAEYHKAI